MAAPLDPAGWDTALREMAEQTGSARAQLVAFGNNYAIPFNKVTDATEGWLEDFVAIDGGNPAVNWRVACVDAPLQITFEPHYAVASRALKSDIYDDFARHHDMTNGCQTVLSHGNQGFFGLATLRTMADGPTTEDQRSLFADMAPFALSAVKMQIALKHKGAQLVTDVFDGMSVIAFLLDRRGKVAALTNTADEFLGRSPCPLRLSGKHLLASRASEDRALQQGISQSLSKMASHVPRIWLPGANVLEGHVCDLFPLPRREWSFGHEPRVLLVVRQINRRRADETAILQKALGLTLAEADVAKLMVEGLSRDQVADLRGSSAGTVHAQIKSLFRKSDVSREAELVALIARLLS